MVIHIYVILVPVLLLVAGIVAAGETSLMALSRTQLETLRERSPLIHRKIQSLIGKPEALLSTVVVGNEFLNIMIGTFVAALIEMQLHGSDPGLLVVLSVLGSTSLTLTFSDVLPKIIGFRLPVQVASVLVYPLSWLQLLLTPVRRIFLWLSRTILGAFGIQPAPVKSLSESDLLTLVEAGAESGSLDPRETQLIYNVFEFSDRTVASVMTPWSKVFCLPEDLTVRQVQEQAQKRRFSRIPILSKNGEVTGVLYAKELLKLLLTPPSEPRPALANAVFPPHIVSEHKKVSRLFRDFRMKKVHFAIVVDEFGSYLGIVTLEDLLNALFQLQRRREKKP